MKRHSPLLAFFVAVLAVCTIGYFHDSSLGQDAPAETAPAEEPVTSGSFLYRDADGNEVAMGEVRTSQQAQWMIEELKRMNELLAEIGGKVDYLVTQTAVEGFDPPSEGDTVVYFNELDEAGLRSLDGIGAAKANAILVNRDSFGYVRSWEDLIQRRVGVGPATRRDMEGTAGVTISFEDPPVEQPNEGQ